MISIDRLKEMAIEELETKLNNWKEQVELQSNFIDSLLKATNNSEWLNKTILDDEASEIIEKIELDYVQLDQLKAQLLDQEAETLKAGEIIHNLKQTLTKIKEICNNNDELKGDFNLVDCDKYKLGKHNLANRILQKISECEGNDELTK